MSDNQNTFNDEDFEKQSLLITEIMVTISIATLSKESIKWLNKQMILSEKNETSEITVYPKQDYGYFIPISQNMIKGKIIPNDVMYILGYAEGKDATWVLVDRLIKVNHRVTRY